MSKRQPGGAPAARVSVEEGEALLERIVSGREPRIALADRRSAALVGECISTGGAREPGRILVRWSDAEGETHERWIPALQGLALREGDRLLLVQPANWWETVVAGVVNGLARRPEKALSPIRVVELLADESIRVTTAAGQPLAELFGGVEGPVIRLLAPDIDFELAGRLRLRAKEIELRAEQGDLRLKASDAVVAEGEIVKLN